MQLPQDKIKKIRQNLLAWYGKYKRDLPWRKEHNPYATFVSEVMLQQTQIRTVIPYFHRWMKKFRTIHELAKADLGEVLKQWEGLGYYSRARNLHKAANLIVEKYDGKIPDNLETLLSLPGIGRYTAGAILSIAFEKPAPIVDGNVARVLSRIFLIKDDVLKPATQKKLYEIAGAIVCDKNPGNFNQAMMELGSLVCFPDLPNCHLCPVAELCLARAKNVQETLPVKSKLLKRKSLSVLAGIIKNDGKILVRRRPFEGIWGGLWEIPSISSNGKRFSSKDVKNFEKLFGIKVNETIKSFPPSLHRLTHLDVTIHPHVLNAVEVRSRSENLDLSLNLRWVTKKDSLKLSFPVPHQKILTHAFN